MIWRQEAKPGEGVKTKSAFTKQDPTVPRYEVWASRSRVQGCQLRQIKDLVLLLADCGPESGTGAVLLGS